MPPATINNHLASLSAFTTWVHSHQPDFFPMGDPTKVIRELTLSPLEPPTLDANQLLRPHDLRHTFSFQLSQATGADPSELEDRLSHRSQRYIQRYPNQPEAVAAGYLEEL